MFRLNKEFDSIDDFPILGSPSPPPALLSGRPKSYAAASSTNQHGYKYAGDLTRKLSKNDFPALSPINNNTNTDSLMGSPWHNGYPTSILEQQQGQSNGPKHVRSKSNELPQQWSRVGSHNLKLTQPMQPPSSRSAPGLKKLDNSTHQAGFYGLLGLLDVIRKVNPDRSMLGLGTDLDTLGLDLNAPDEIYSSFISPWSDNNTQEKISQQTSGAIQYGYYIPHCYRAVKVSPPANQRMTVFSDNILFYTFYCVTRDESQDAAAQELYNRNWRYHKELGLWVTKEQTESFKPPSSPHDIEQGFFIFFDPTTWQKVKKGWTIVWDAMEIKRSSPSSFSSPTSTSTL